MQEALNQIKKLFIIFLSGFVFYSLVIIILKKVVNVSDMITLSSKLTIVAMFLMVISILVAYFVYDRFAKKSQAIEEEDDEEQLNKQLKLFKKASLIKMAMLDFVGFISATMLLLLYQTSYLYMLGIIVVFFMINFPNEIKFRRDFVKRKDLF